MPDQALRTSLLDLLRALGSTAQHVLLGGGYGLYLKQLHMASAGQRTLIAAQWWPSPRATEDLDLLLNAEIVADAAGMREVRRALDQLDYRAVEETKYLQFVHRLPSGQVVKIDLLTSQLNLLRDIPGVQADARRARPKAKDRPDLHAHPTDGAIGLDEAPTMIPVSGTLSSGEPSTAAVRLPPPFSYLLMKLTAYRDRRGDPDKDLGRHHALDMFRIVAMLTEAELQSVRDLARRYTGDATVQACRLLIASDFATASSPGVLKMLEHPLWRRDDEGGLSLFIETLHMLI